MKNTVYLLFILAVPAARGFCAPPETMVWPFAGPMASAASADGKKLAIGGVDGNVRLFGFNGLKVSISALNCGNRTAELLGMSADGGLLAAGGEGWLALFNTAQGRKLGEIQAAGGRPSRAAFSKDGKLLAVVYNNEVKLFSVPGGKALGVFKTADPPALAIANSARWRKYAASPAEVKLLTASQTSSFKKFRDWQKLWVSPGGRLLAYGNGPALMALSGGEPPALDQPDKSRVEHAAFSGDGGYLAVVREYGTIEAWDLKTGRRTVSFNWREDNPMADMEEMRLKMPRALHFVNGSSHLCVLSEAGPVELWDAGTGKKAKLLTPNTSGIGSLALLPDKRLLLSGDWSGAVTLWDLDKGALLKRFPAPLPDWPVELAASGDGKYFFYGDADVHQASLRTLDTYEEAAAFKKLPNRSGPPADRKYTLFTHPMKPGESSLVQVEAFRSGGLTAARGSSIKLENPSAGEKFWDCSPDGGELAYGMKDGSLGLADLDDGTLNKVSAAGNYIWTVNYSTDGKSLAVIDIGGVVTVLDTADWKKIATMPGWENDGYSGTPSSADGYYAVMPEKPPESLAALRQGSAPKRQDVNRLKLVDKQTKKETILEEPGEPHLAFSQDSSLLAAIREDGSIKLWDTSSGEARAELPAPPVKQYSVSFWPGGKYLLAGGADGVIRLYDLNSEKQLLSITGFNDGEWLLSLPNGKYKSSPGAAKYLKSRSKEDAGKYAAPEEVEAALITFWK